MHRLFTATILGAVAMSAAPVLAVMNGGNLDTTNGAGVAGFNNIGVLNNASAVYLGNDWVLTVVHVYDLNQNAPITFSSTTLTPDTSGTRTAHILTNPDSSNSDLVLVPVTGNTSSLSNLSSLATSAPTAGEPMTMIGEGFGRSTPNPGNDAELFWDVTGPSNNPTWTPESSISNSNAGGFAYVSQAKRWGTNTVANENANSSNPVVFLDSTSNSFGFESFFYNDLTDFTNSDKSGAGEATIADDDSGGGVFSNGTLIGINDEKLTFANQPSSPPVSPNPADSNTAVFGDGSFFIDLSTYESQIVGFTSVPEPTCLTLLGSGFILMLRRRSRIAC
jgi:hypothetical protein